MTTQAERQKDKKMKDNEQDILMTFSELLRSKTWGGGTVASRFFDLWNNTSIPVLHISKMILFLMSSDSKSNPREEKETQINERSSLASKNKCHVKQGYLFLKQYIPYIILKNIPKIYSSNFPVFLSFFYKANKVSD